MLTYQILGEPSGWIYPIIEIGGIFVILCGFLFKCRFILALGSIIVAIGALPEHDLALFIASLLGAFGLWQIIKMNQ